MTDPRIRFDIAANATGQSDVAQMTQELEKLDAAVDPSVAQRAQALAAELRQLGAQQDAVRRFGELKRETEAARVELERAQAAAQQFGQQMAGSGAPTRAQAGQFEKLRDAVRSAKTELQLQTGQLDAARAQLGQLGIATDQVAATQLRLRSALRDAGAETQELSQRAEAARVAAIEEQRLAGIVEASKQRLAQAATQAVQDFDRTARATDAARAALLRADQAVDAYRASIVDLAKPTAEEAAQLGRLSERARQAQIAFQSQAQSQAQAASAMRSAGVSTDQVAAAQARAEQAAQRLSASYRTQADVAEQSAASQVRSHRRISEGVDSISTQLGRLQNLSIAGILGGQTAQLLGSVTQTADAYNNLAARIRLVSGEGAAFQQAFEGVFDVATRTNSSLEATGTLFTRIAAAGRDIGVSQREALQLTESINQAVQISGASAAASDAAITQLIQGLQSGVLRGEEFNSVMEQAPRIADVLTASLGVQRGELRKMAEQGKLTSQTVIESFRRQSGTLKQEFEQLPLTVGRALTNLRTEYSRFIGQLDQSSGATAVVAQGIQSLAENLDSVARIAAVAGSMLVANLAVKGVGALRALSSELAATAGASSLLTASLDKIPTVINITVAATGFEIGFRIGEMLRENSELARQLGVGVVGFFELLLNDLRLLQEAATAIFTSDTVDAAFERYQQRNLAIGDTLRAMFEDARKSPREVAAATEQAAAGTAKLGDAATSAGARIASAGASGAAGVGAVGKAAESARGAIDELAKAAGVALPATAVSSGAAARALGEAAAQSKVVADRIGKDLPAAIDKLSGPELARFRSEFAAALQGAGDQSRLLQQLLVETGRRAAEALGVDVVRASATLSAEFNATLDNLALLVRALPELGRAGVDAGAVLRDALSKSIDSARNQAELEALRQRIKALGDQGKLTRPEVEALFDAIGQRSRDVKVDVDKLAVALKVFGLTSQQENEKVATSFKRAFDVIRNDGTVSLQQKQEAFRKYAEAAVTANRGVVDAELQAVAQTLKLKVAVDDMGRAVVQSSDAVGGLADTTRGAFVGLSVALEDAGRQLDVFTAKGIAARNAAIQAEQDAARIQYDKQGFALGADGSRLSALGSTDPMDYTRDLATGALVLRADAIKRLTGQQPPPAAPAPAPAPAPALTPALAPAQPSSSVTTVRIELGGRTTSVNVASPSDAQALTGLLRELEFAASRTVA